MKKLPYDAEVEYIESNGGQYIDTGYFPNNKTRWECTCSPTITSSQFMGCINNGAHRFHFSFYDSGYIRGCMGLTQTDIMSADSNIRTYWIDSSEKTVGYDTVSVPSNYPGSIPSISIWLFGRNSDNASYIRYTNFRIYGSKIFDNGVLVRDFIPVRFTNGLGQSEGAMYDKVSKQLFRNQGTGAFLYGKDTKVVTKPLIKLWKMKSLPPTAKSYIQNGLVAQYDGIENIGYKMHSNDVSSWVDLKSGQTVSFSKGDNAYFKDNAFHREAALGNFILPIRCPEKNSTVEIVVDVQGPVGTDNPRIVGSSDTSKRFEFDIYDTNISFSPRALWRKPDNTGERISSLNWEISSIGAYRVWAVYLMFGDNGFYVGDSYAQKWSYLESYLARYDGIYLNVGAWANTSSAMTGDIYAIRKYSRQLSFDEIAYNYSIDQKRFAIS